MQVLTTWWQREVELSVKLDFNLSGNEERIIYIIKFNMQISYEKIVWNTCIDFTNRC